MDTHDLFATLVVSLNLGNNTRFFRTYPNTFTTDDAAQNLSSLRFSQSNRSTDPNDPQRIITTTTTTTFTMTREIAKGICQQFMDARLIETATDPTATVFKDRGIYSITPKGLHILERFITKNGIAADHLVRVFTTQPICMRLLHLERRSVDDDIIVSKPVLEVVFKRFIGIKQPNYITEPGEIARCANQNIVKPFVDINNGSSTTATRSTPPPHKPNFERANGIEMQDITEKLKNGSVILTRHVFSSAGAIDWLCDHSTCCCRDEAAELLAHFVRYGFITLHWDKTRSDHSTTVQQQSKGSGALAKLKNSMGSGDGGDHVEAEFRWGPKVTYRVSDEGRKLANWDGLSANNKANKGEKKRSSDGTEDSHEPSLTRGASYTSQQHHNGSTQSLNNNNGATNNGSGAAFSSTTAAGAIGSNSAGGEWSLAGGMGIGNMLDSQLLSKMALKDIFEVDGAGNSTGAGGGENSSVWNKEGQHSSTTRLRAILEDIRLRALFREYLRNNYCEENLGFWLDVQDFRRRFFTTSSAMGGSGPSSSSSANNTGGPTQPTPAEKSRKPLLRGLTAGFGLSSTQSGAASNAMESHQNDLNIAAVNIYRLYLAPQSPSELNIDHNLRADVVNFISKCADEASIPLSTLQAPRHILPGMSASSLSQNPAQHNPAIPNGTTGSPSSSSPDLNSGAESSMQMDRTMVLPLRATQVQTLLRYYERIQDHIFRLLATDQVPKFIRTPEFLVLLKGGNPVSFAAFFHSIFGEWGGTDLYSCTRRISRLRF